jgi:hypothetical protein
VCIRRECAREHKRQRKRLVDWEYAREHNSQRLIEHNSGRLINEFGDDASHASIGLRLRSYTDRECAVFRADRRSQWVLEYGVCRAESVAASDGIDKHDR